MSEIAKRWSREENDIFVDIISAYRKAVANRNIRHMRQNTEQFVADMLSHPLLTHRSRQAVYEHLTYFDNLLEGIGTIQNYGVKDSGYFGKLRSGMRLTQHPLGFCEIDLIIWILPLSKLMPAENAGT